MADPNTEDHSGEMEHELHRLEDNIADAEKKLEARREDATSLDGVAGEAQEGDDPQAAASEQAAAVEAAQDDVELASADD